jgi:hypothetical protein
MRLPQTVAEILREHVTLVVECIDRLYLNAYVPRVQYESGVGRGSSGSTAGIRSPRRR